MIDGVGDGAEEGELTRTGYGERVLELQRKVGEVKFVPQRHLA